MNTIYLKIKRDFRALSKSRLAIAIIWLGVIADGIRRGAGVPTSQWGYDSHIEHYVVFVLTLPFFLIFFGMTLTERYQCKENIFKKWQEKYQNKIDRVKSLIEKKISIESLIKFSKRLNSDALFAFELLSTGISGLITTFYTSKVMGCYILSGALISAAMGLFAFLLSKPADK